MSRRLFRPTKQYLHGPADAPVTVNLRSGGRKELPAEIRQLNSAARLAKYTKIWTITEGYPSRNHDVLCHRWDADPTYFAPGGKGNQIREYRLPQRGRKTVRGKSKPTTDDLLDLI